jgi:hypothetical protein
MREAGGDAVGVGDRGEIDAGRGSQRPGGGFAGGLTVEIRARAQYGDAIEVEEIRLRPAFSAVSVALSSCWVVQGLASPSVMTLA